MLSVVVGDSCGYVRRPLATTNNTVVVNFECGQSTPLSHHVALELPDDTTHVAVRLVHCHTVPVGLFANVTDNLTSVTVASEDAVQLLEGTFEGLGRVTEFRLLGFTMLKNFSRSLLEPLRNIRTLILDGFGSANIQLDLPDLASVIRKLSGTPIRRLVLNRLKDKSFSRLTMKVDNFTISNASVKELIITDTPLYYEGSISRAFPDLVCFCGGGSLNDHTYSTLPALWDLMLLSDRLEEVIIYRLKNLPVLKPDEKRMSKFSLTQYLQFLFMAKNLYPELFSYFYHRSMERNDQDCVFGFTVKLGTMLSKITLRDLPVWIKTEKPLCVEEDNNLIYLDVTGSFFAGTVPLTIGLKKIEYISLENTGIRKLPITFLQYTPSLKVLKLSKNDIDDFIENIDGDFFGSCPTLADIYLDGCNMTNIPTSILSRSVNLQHLDISKNYLRSFDVDLQNCTRLDILNFSGNSIGSITQKRISQLTRLALRKPGGEHLVVDLSYNRLHCLCNSTRFIKWLQRSDTNIKFQDFDSYTCLYPNGSTVRAFEVVVSELEQQCSVIQTLANGSGCPCDEEQRSRLQQVWVHLDGFFCRNDEGVLVAMTVRPFPSCFNPYARVSFIAPVVVGGILGITALITVGLLIYHRNTRQVSQVRQCLQMYPVRFINAALQYVMAQNRQEEHAVFRYDMIIFVQNDDRSNIHNYFIEALQRDRYFITRDDFRPGVAEVEAMAESVDVCQWIVPVLTRNFLSDPVCVDFVNSVQFSRPHALISVVWEELPQATDISVSELLRTGDPLYWPGDGAEPEDKRNFWSSFLDRATPL